MQPQPILTAETLAAILASPATKSALAEAEAAPELDLGLFERLTKMARAESAQAAALARALRITNQAKHPVTAGRMAAMPAPTLGIEALSGVRHHG